MAGGSQPDSGGRTGSNLSRPAATPSPHRSQGIGLGDVFDAAPIHEGRVGFGFRSYQAGSEMTLDEFRIEPEVS